MSTGLPQADVPPTTGFSGEVFDAAGARMTTGRVEARIADQLCGVASNRNHGSFDGYIIGVLRTDAAGRCPEDAPITFTVDGRRAEPAIPNTPGRRDALDLTVS